MQLWKILTVFAALSLITSQGSAAITGVKETGNIRYVSGGVGEAARNEFERAAEAFDVKLELATASGAYLASTNVWVFGPGGQQLLATTTSGPLLLLDLPAGSYRIEAEHDGRRQGARVTVAEGEKVKPLTLSWAQ
ncbi:carboxypeptidase-like regulatory domain-containing protein [Microbulbifer guangxiensis]|uniref:carboxypeptidase-like regulatory domain-containing protein n=1 Tax=Microbulbifer guangxiensis TaxID=2904249 RepID=UPI001F3D965C|nr:carboxypeptidase-like regulatory domain-containing protein [Microbulbifer guangxiensis]